MSAGAGHRLLVAVTDHGLGHLAQVAPLLRAALDACPGLTVTVSSAIPARTVRQRIGRAVDVMPAADDFGVVVHGGFEIDTAATAARYRALHSDFERAVSNTAARFAEARPDLILSNAGYLALAAAARLGVPGYLLGSLEWATLLRGFQPLGEQPFIDEIEAAYGKGQGIFQIEPTHSALVWGERVALGAVADAGQRRAEALRATIGVDPGRRLVLCAFGGGTPAPPATDWARCRDTIFLAPPAWSGADNVLPLDRIDWPFIDLVASCDACIAKLGYGIAAEAVRHQTPLLYHRRHIWPEDDGLAAWLLANGRAREIALPQLDASTLAAALDSVMEQPRKPGLTFDAPRRFTRAVLDRIG